MKEFNEEKFNKIWDKNIIKNNKRFEEKYTNLYDELYKRFEIEFDNLQSIESKCGFLQELMDKITEANNDMNNNYNISELAEESESKLKGLHNFFEVEMQKLLSGLVKNKRLVTDGKRGRKGVNPEPAVEYLQNITDERKNVFLIELKKNYGHVEHRIFNCLISVLSDLGYLKPVTNKELKISFEKEFERKMQSETNFNNQFKKDLKTANIYKQIEFDIKRIIEEKLIF